MSETRPSHPTLNLKEREGTRVARQQSSSLDENFNEHILLTPPPQTVDSHDPLGSTSCSPTHIPAIDQTHFHGQNVSQSNTRHRATLSQYSGFDAVNLLNGLSIRTDGIPPHRSASVHSLESDGRLRSSISAASLPRRVPSLRNTLHSTAGSISPGSVISSPMLAALVDVTPLPSPTIGAFETWKVETWKSLAWSRSRGSSTSSRAVDLPATLSPPSSFSPSSPKKKAYSGLTQTASNSSTTDDLGYLAADFRDRTRSLSEYIPGELAVPKQRNVAVSTSIPPSELETEPTIQREEFLAVQRGIVTPVVSAVPPGALVDTSAAFDDEPPAKRQKLEVFTAASINSGQARKYTAIRDLGHGTFSKVVLAVRQLQHEPQDSIDYSQDSVNMAGVRARSRRLVAIKIVEQGPRGGADAERIAISLQREVEILKAVKHPSIVHLKAFGVDGVDGSDPPPRTILVMNYCPGGDLFEVASSKLEVLTAPLVRRIFAELVSAIRYLHQKFIVHRDIKLENVLLNIPIQVHSDVPDWQALDRAVITVTDLGLSRRIPEPPESPLLTTRCGSEDYAAPEILMGQPYDGRQTDAWALGVLLYSLMEGRLPFDPMPGARGDPATLRARTPHRIARCEWAWVRYGDADGEWDPVKGQAFDGAQLIVDGLLKRNTRRKPLAEIREMPWVTDGIKIDGGLRWVEEDAYG